ncbi:MAG: AAA family ATPase [Desulfuromonadaceae bacterium]
MIVSFSVENFRSFAGEETFSLVASNKISGLEDHTVAIPGSSERVLRTAVLYGANGAGKSNLYRAIEYFKNMALLPRSKNSGTGREVFRFSEFENKLSSFDMQFIVGDKLYRYGFRTDDHRIAEEWLLHINGTKEKVVFERITTVAGEVTIEGKGLKSAGKKIEALATIGGPPNQTFLATIRATLAATDYGKELSSIFKWVEDSLQMISPQANFVHLGHLLSQDEEFQKFASEFLRMSSTGVNHLEVNKRILSEDDLKSLLKEPFVADILNNVKENGTAVFRLGDDAEVLVEKAEENNFYLLTIHAAHEHIPGKKVSLQLADESDGTRRLLHLIPALHQLRTNGGVYVVDEIDRSMHPMLTLKFLEFFLKSCVGCHRQLIITTHESNLLNLDLLRRDEIWFAEKDKQGATRLYSLADFKIRKDLEIRKHYLQGRFGAVPFLGNIDRLLEEDVTA